MMWIKWNSDTLLVGIQNDETAMENNLAVP
jgi:hypothetical protein